MQPNEYQKLVKILEKLNTIQRELIKKCLLNPPFTTNRLLNNLKLELDQHPQWTKCDSNKIIRFARRMIASAIPVKSLIVLLCAATLPSFFAYTITINGSTALKI